MQAKAEMTLDLRQRLLLAVSCATPFGPVAGGVLIASAAVALGFDPVLPSLVGMALSALVMYRAAARVRLVVSDGGLLVRNFHRDIQLPPDRVLDIRPHYFAWGKGTLCHAVVVDGKAVPVHATFAASEREAVETGEHLREMLASP